jgi:hypothetical protein
MFEQAFKNIDDVLIRYEGDEVIGFTSKGDERLVPFLR